MAEIPFSEFAKIEFRVGRVVGAEKIEGSDKLIKMEVDFGNGDKRIVVAGIAKKYSVEELLWKEFVFVTNLERKKIFGIESQAMILAAEDKEGNLALVTLDKEIEEGARVH